MSGKFTHRKLPVSVFGQLRMFSLPPALKLSFIIPISCDDGSTQTCLPPEELYHQDVTATEVPNENFKTLIVIIVAALVSVFIFVLIFATIIYVQRWQMRRFFNFSQLNENVEEITNPIFDLSGGGDDVGMPVTNVLSQVSFALCSCSLLQIR